MGVTGRGLIKAIFSNWLVIGTCCVILLFNILFYYFFVRHQEETISRLERRYTLVRKRKLVKTDPRLKILAKKKMELKKFVAALPQESAFPELVHQIYAMIQKNGLSSTRMAFKPQDAGRLPLVKYATSFTVMGTYGQIKQFLAELLDSKNLFCIDGFVLEKKRKERKVAMTLRLSLYLK